MKRLTIVLLTLVGCENASPGASSSKLKSESLKAGDRKAGVPCTQDEECESLACLFIGGQSQCAASCADGVGCDNGLVCQKKNPRELASPTVCGEPAWPQCSACLSDADCGTGRACLEAAEGKVCGIDCTVSALNCPMGFACVAVVDDNGEPLSKQCLPDPGVCFCPPGQTEGCKQWVPPAVASDCTGDQCPFRPGYTAPTGPRSQGPSGCVPSAEICNGKDDDCDGMTDEGVDGKPLAEACSNAGCGGKRLCFAGEFGTCDAPAPQAETCNGKDDDCDGQIDEGFLESVNSCGSCGYVCPGTGQSNITTACEATFGGYQCAMAVCRGDSYDGDGHLGNGCEAAEEPPHENETNAVAASSVIHDDDNGWVEFVGRFGADGIGHESEPFDRSQPNYMAAHSTDWYRVDATDDWLAEMELRTRLDVSALPSTSLFEVCLSPSRSDTFSVRYGDCGARPANQPQSWCSGTCCCVYGGSVAKLPLDGDGAPNIDDTGANGGTYYARVSWKSGTFVPGMSMNAYTLRVCDDGEEHSCPAADDCGLPKHCN